MYQLDIDEVMLVDGGGESSGGETPGELAWNNSGF
jgi:hypothetical protein